MTERTMTERTGRRYFVTGATGLVGRRLVEALLARGDQVTALSRSPEAAAATLPAGVRIVAGDPGTVGPWTAEVAGHAGVVHLAGENVFDKRWSAAQKERLRASRVDSGRNVARAVSDAPTPPVLVSASAIGYYGLLREGSVSESDGPGDDFLAQLCVAWEASVADAARVTRVVNLRIGIVLDERGGALQTMARPFRLGLGGIVGNGRQGVSWIHRKDLTALLLKALDDPELSGPVNAVAPGPVSNAEFSRALAKRLGRPCLFPVPKVGLKALFGEVGDVMAGGQYVLPKKAEAAGFRFAFSGIEAALRDLPL